MSNFLIDNYVVKFIHSQLITGLPALEKGNLNGITFSKLSGRYTKIHCKLTA